MGERSNGVQSPSALELLAEEIASAAKTVSKFLKHNSSQDGIDQVLAGSFATPHDAPAVISKAKRSLYEATQSIQQLLLSPTDFHLHATLDLQRLAAYRWLLNFDVPDHVPLHEAVTYAAVADSARVPEDQLMRFARHAMTGGLFHEPVEGYIAHTPVSAGLRRPAPVRDTMLFLTETNLPTAAKVVEMTESLTASVDTNDRTGTSSVEDPRTAFQLAHGTSLSFFPYLSKHPQIASRLAAGMRTISAASESHVSHLVTSYPWSQLPKGTTILDMGGSRGHVAVALATQYSQLKFIVQDLPPVIAEASKQILDESVRGRVSFHAHSFLEPQPVEHVNGVDVFLIRQCLNNWPYMDAVRILRAILPSMEGDHKRLLINNVVVPLPFSSCPTQQTQTGRNPVYGEGMRDEAIARVRDLAMLQLMNGAERDLRQWRSLLREADPRLEIVQVTKPEGSLLSLLEVKLKPKSGP